MAQQMIERRRRFVYCEFEPAVAESQQDDEYSVEPPAAKKTRGANAKYVYYGIAESLDPTDVKESQEIVAVVARSTLYDDEYTCNCPIGTLRKHCKHVLVVECLNGNREWPNITLLRHTIQQAERNGHVGRPRNHTRALAVD